MWLHGVKSLVLLGAYHHMLIIYAFGCAERVAVLNFDFTSGSDGITSKDVMPDFEPGMALGIRLAARGLFNVSTEELRAKLRPLPAYVESFFNVEEFQSVGRDLQKDFAYTEPAAKSCCRNFQQCLADLVVADNNKTSLAAKHGLCQLSVLLGMRLPDARDSSIGKLTWDGQPPAAQLGRQPAGL